MTDETITNERLDELVGMLIGYDSDQRSQAKGELRKEFITLKRMAAERESLRDLLLEAHRTITDLEIERESLLRKWDAQLQERLDEARADQWSEMGSS